MDRTSPVTVPCPAATEKECIGVHNGTFAWSQESPPCLHRYQHLPQQPPLYLREMVTWVPVLLT